MKLRIEHLTILLMISALLLAVGCGGCTVKNSPKSPTDAPTTKTPEAKEPISQEEFTPEAEKPDTEQDPPVPVYSPLMYKRSENDYTLLPLQRPVIPPQVRKSANAAVKAAVRDRLAALKKEGVKPEFKEIALVRRDAEDRIFVEAIGKLAYAQYLAYSWSSRAYPFAKKALAENPNDFDTMLTWLNVYTSGDGEYKFDDSDRLTTVRRLYEINPGHPYVLHELAKITYAQHPKEALEYAKKAQQLEHRYVLKGVNGLCYFQLGDYENALAAFERSYAAADDAWKQAPLNKIHYIKRVMNDSDLQKKLQTLREKK